MTFSVTYRAKDGKPAIETFEADNREALFKILAGRGISATRVEAGVKETPKHGTALGWTSIRIAAIVVVVIAFIVCVILAVRNYFSVKDGDSGTKNKTSGWIADVTPTQPNQQPVADSQTQAPQSADENEPVKSEFDDGRVLQSAKTNGMYIVEMYTMPDGKKLKKYRYSTPSIWHSNTDQLLHMALSTPPGVTLPPIPYTRGTATKDFYDSLNVPIVINDDDSDEVREAKERVIEARETVKQLLSEGYTFEDIMADFEQQNAKDAELRLEVSERIEEIKREGDIDMAREYMQKANEFLRNAGITEVRDRSLKTEEDEN